MARVAALVDDLLFRSKVAELLGAGGHEVVPAPGAGAPAAAQADVLVVDLTQGADPARVTASAPAGARTLGVYSHVEPEVRAAALAAGFDQVVPRSRFMREGAELVARLASRR